VRELLRRTRRGSEVQLQMQSQPPLLEPAENGVGQLALDYDRPGNRGLAPRRGQASACFFPDPVQP
jgi:hypothetical protein